MSNQLNFDLTDMQYFAAIIRTGGFSKAAEQLYIAQPFLSRKIHALEERLGVTLIERTTRQMHLTPAGKLFYQHAAQVLNECEALERALSPDAAHTAPEIRLGYGSNGQFSFAMRLIAVMRQTNRELSVRAEACDTLERLYTGKLDVALVMPCEAKDQDWLEAVPLETAGLSFFVSASDPLTQQSGEVSISEALTRQFLLPQPRNVSSLMPCTTLYEAIRLQLLLCGVPAQNLAIARGSQAFSLAITAGNAVGVMPDSSEIIANHLLICRPVAEYRSGFEIMLAWPRFSTSPALAQVFRSAAERIAASADL